MNQEICVDLFGTMYGEQTNELHPMETRPESLLGLSGLPQVTQGDFSKRFENIQAILKGTD